jgi:hypothetical protein
MYIYTPQNKQLGIDDSVMGRCNVIFVTKDRSLRSEDLCSIYISQRNAITGEV